MQLTQQTVIRRTDSRYRELLRLCHLSKNLYNAGLYRIRQHYFDTGKYLDYFSLYQSLRKEENPDLRALPSQTAQQVLKQLDRDFRSFFSLVKKKDRKCRIPDYKDKDGLNAVFYTNQQIRKRSLSNGILSVPGLDCTFRTNLSTIDQVRLVPRTHQIVLEVVYTVTDKDRLPDNGKYMAIDLGVDNLATLTFSDAKRPVVLNGRILKSINQYYNKKRSGFQAKKATSKMKRLTCKRNSKVKDQLHKVSRQIVNHAVSNQYNTVVVGYNREWKQDTRLGTQNNQNFVSIPHYKLVQMLDYKCKLECIRLVLVDEAYTSKASALDRDRIPSLKEKNPTFSGTRKHRGLYVTGSGQTVNADVNGSLNILRKVAGDEIEILSPASRGCVFHPVRISLD
jgi:putative transposase